MIADIPETFRETGRFFLRANDAPITQFQVLGERGTGTNMVRKVIDKNIKIERTEGLGWKHAVPHMAAVPPGCLVICVVRNAVSWALSMHKRPWHSHPDLQAMEFSEFIRTPWRGIVDRAADFEELHPEMVPYVAGTELQYDRHPITGRPFENLFALRNVKQQAMLGMLNRGVNVLLVKAELAQVDQNGFAAWMIEELGLPLEGLRIKPVQRRLGNRFNRAIPVETPADMSGEDHAFMMDQLDLETEAALGYDYSL
ncbi:hypothetical protein [Rhodalgimonas zhirmunskyi]|uniref:Uncharacterized protein n=1 Tax=Rhodalgimonas zhirmunskyi TaxID=2964767 RepID=A0AAJ1X4A2_9RHOB|nr:hypothetical protein [Rhodoalgimonas zhirmunskyi]MDQ2092914.1 hypothetical protein [Rhodoalgimonas zhirmunskyi]